MSKTKSIYNEEIQNIITIKLDYKSNEQERILDCIKNYNSLFRSTYSFYQQVPDLKQAETTRLQSKLNNIFLDKWYFNSAVFDVKSFKNKKKKDEKVIFGNYEKDLNLYYLSLEEIGIRESFSDFKSMYSFIKNSKTRYRVSLDDLDSSRVFRKFFIKSYTEFYDFL